MIKEHPGKSFFPDFIEDWDFIRFETGANSLIAEVINTEFDDGRIFVATRPPMGGFWAENHLHVFDDAGRYVTGIGSQGRGPDEFININDFRLDKKNKHAVILDNSKRVFKFDYNGGLIERIETDTAMTGGSPFHFYYLPDGNILIYHNISPTINNSSYTLVNEDFWKIANLDTLIYGISNPPAYSADPNRHPVAINGNDVVLLKSLCDTVFIYSQESLTPVCYLDSYGTMPAGVKSIKKEDIMVNHDKIVELMNPDIVKSVYATPDHVLIYENKNLLVLDKSFDRGHEVRVMPDKVTSMPIAKNPPFQYYRIDGVHGDRLYTWIQAIDLIDYKDECEAAGMELSEKHKALFDGLKEDDNPVLVFYTMKEDLEDL
jgi:hypothetical protein